MFTGLIQETGRVLAPPPRLQIRCRLAATLKRGDSVAVDGVCLTVTDLAAGTFRADVMPETLRRSTLGRLRTGSEANLERALAAGDTLDGHLVTGHVDGTGVIRSVSAEGNARVYTVSCTEQIASLLANKGPVAVDGISLTVVSVSTGVFSVSVIPHTRMATTLKTKKPGNPVNIECDPVARYVHRSTTPPETIKRTSTFLRTLQENGFTGDN